MRAGRKECGLQNEMSGNYSCRTASHDMDIAAEDSDDGGLQARSAGIGRAHV